MEIGSLIRRAAVHHGDAPCLVEGARTVSFRAFDRLTDRVGNALLASGLAEGDRVGVLLPNGIDCLVAYYALAKAGLVRVTLNGRETADDHAYKLADSGARGLIHAAALIDADAVDVPVRIDDELIHYDWLESGGLAMPRSSSEPGERNRQGPGIFRGRYGTAANSHAAGTPVIEVPIRYWDRWAEGADAPEMNYLTLSVSQPNAFWGSCFWDIREPAGAGPRLGVLQRTDPDVPWDAPPQGTQGLDLLWDGLQDGEGNAIGRQSDRIEWRVFLRHEPGSFDPVGGLSHAWKRVPRLSYFGAEYLGPGMVLKRVER